MTSGVVQSSGRDFSSLWIVRRDQPTSGDRHEKWNWDLPVEGGCNRQHLQTLEPVSLLDSLPPETRWGRKTKPYKRIGLQSTNIDRKHYVYFTLTNWTHNRVPVTFRPEKSGYKTKVHHLLRWWNGPQPSQGESIYFYLIRVRGQSWTLLTSSHWSLCTLYRLENSDGVPSINKGGLLLFSLDLCLHPSSDRFEDPIESSSLDPSYLRGGPLRLSLRALGSRHHRVSYSSSVSFGRPSLPQYFLPNPVFSSEVRLYVSFQIQLYGVVVGNGWLLRFILT